MKSLTTCAKCFSSDVRLHLTIFNDGLVLSCDDCDRQVDRSLE